MPDTHYDVLDVSPDASEREIKQAYQRKVNEHQSEHRDDPSADEQLIRIRAARETLLDTQARKRYDRTHNIRSGGEETSDRTDSTIGQEIATRLWLPTDATDVVRSPTLIRLAGAALCSLVVVWMLRANTAVSPATEFGIVLFSLLLWYVGYGVFAPLPFEEPRQKPPFSPTRARIWPVLGLHLLGLGILWVGILGGAPNGGLGYALMAVLYVFIVSIGCLVLGGLLSVAWTVLYERNGGVRIALALGLITSAVFLFTPVGKGSTLSAFIETVTVYGPPWIPSLRAGPLHLGSLLNFGISVVMLVGLFVGVVGAVWALTVAPWRDRYEHGYRIHPTAWNLLAVVPFVSVAWMWLSGVTTLTITVESTTYVLLRPLVERWLVLFPTPLVGAYLLRRRLEPLLQQ